MKHHLADTGVRIEGRRAELGPMWDAFDRLKGFQCKGGSPKVAVSESYGSEKYDYNLIRSKLTKTERRVVYNVVERTGPNGPEQVGTFTPRDVVVVDPDRCHIVLWVGHVMNIEDPRSGVPSLTTPETGAGPGGGPYEEFRPTVGFACCFAQASKEAAERMGFDTLPTSVGPQEPLWFLPRDTQALDGEEAAQKYPSVVARLFSDAARKAEEVLCKDRCCKERGIRIDILWGKR